MVPSKVYILDGDLDIQQLLKSYLKDELINVTYYADSKSLKKDIQDSKPDLMILSRFSSDIDGLDLIKELKTQNNLGTTPIILMTSSMNDKQVAESQDIGINFYLTKPLKKNSVTSAIRSMLQQKLQTDVYHEQNNFLEVIPNITNLYTANIKNHKEAESIIKYLCLLTKANKELETALKELIFNSIEHGIYKLGQKRKSELVQKGKWSQELIKKEKLHEADQLYVNIRYKKKKDSIEILIIDSGKGFKWKDHILLDQSLSHSVSGRGIAKCMALEGIKIQFNDKGNEVKITKFI